MAADDHAILVGINRYSSSTLKDLEGPENDVQAMTEWLIDPNGGDVPKKQIRAITSSRFPNQSRPVTTDLYEAFEKLIDLADQRSPKPAGRRLYIFMAGHGFGPALRNAALLMANAKPRRYGHSVCGGTVADHFAEAAYFDEVVLLMDCCRDQLSKGEASTLPWELEPGERTPTNQWIYAFSACYDQRSREKLIDGEVRGVFTAAVLDALRSGVHKPETLETLVGARMGELLGNDAYRPPQFQPGPIKLELGSTLVQPTLRITLEADPDQGPVPIVVGRGGGDSFRTKKLKNGDTWDVPLPIGLWEIQAGSQEAVRVKLKMRTQDVTITA
jgi:uncharacterized caspase-like protein